MARRVLDAVHQTARGLHKARVMSTRTMREFDALCLPPVKALTAAQIKRLRTRNKASQGAPCVADGTACGGASSDDWVRATATRCSALAAWRRCISNTAEPTTTVSSRND